MKVSDRLRSACERLQTDYDAACQPEPVPQKVVLPTKPDPAKSPMVHTMNRASERFGITLTKKDYKKLAKDIQSGFAIKQRTMKNDREKWIVRLPTGKPASVIYHTKRKLVMTVYEVCVQLK